MSQYIFKAPFHLIYKKKNEKHAQKQRCYDIIHVTCTPSFLIGRKKKKKIHTNLVNVHLLTLCIFNFLLFKKEWRNNKEIGLFSDVEDEVC